MAIQVSENCSDTVQIPYGLSVVKSAIFIATNTHMLAMTTQHEKRAWRGS